MARGGSFAPRFVLSYTSVTSTSWSPAPNSRSVVGDPGVPSRSSGSVMLGVNGTSATLVETGALHCSLEHLTALVLAAPDLELSVSTMGSDGDISITPLMASGPSLK